MSNEVKEYVVTLKKFDDLDDFYDDMETPGGNLYIPNRQVEVCNRRPISRNTHYYLTPTEAEQLRSDPRVLDVSLTPDELGIIYRPKFTQTETDWDKSSFNGSNYNNWGLLRSVEGSQRLNWGFDGTASQTGTITTTSEGANVDVVIVDGLINPDHPEYAVNSDGTGGSRVIQYNWYQHRAAVEGTSNSTYTYGSYTGTGQEANNNHGAHVAGTAVGNTQGWARKSNIYNISPYGLNSLSGIYLFDYIRAFHNAKSVNPLIGRKNPTITNNSYGYAQSLYYTDVNELRYRNTIYSGPFTTAQLDGYGAITDGGYIYMGYRYSAVEADIEDAIEDGIIVIAAASNDALKIDVYGGVDYDNYLYSNTYGYFYYHRGTTPGAAFYADNTPSTICVGSIGTNTDDRKSYFSNCGPRVDIYAPGSYIQSSFNSTASYGGADDPRNSTYKLGKISGTSMASPQVCGVVACLAETYPDLPQEKVRDLLTKISKSNQVDDDSRITYNYTVTNSGSSDYVFSGDGSGNDITITVVSGSVLKFNVNATGHPFWIKTVQGTGTSNGVTTGSITNNGAASGLITWDTYGVVPGTYYYNCQFHASMTGQIIVVTEFEDIYNNYNLCGSENRFLFYPKERETSGGVFPNKVYLNRPGTGSVYPRVRTRQRK